MGDIYCKGVTLSRGGYDLRGSDSPVPSTGESSWVITNFDECHPHIACQYSDEQAGYLAACPDGSTRSCPQNSTLEAAKAACDQSINCTGVTHSRGNYALRGGASPQAPPTGETSWIVTNPTE